jgi:hypothetical protein
MAGREGNIGGSTKALLITIASLVLWTTWNYVRDTCHPLADLSCGVLSDHTSHLGFARMFTEVGTDIYLKPREELGQPLTESEKEALPPDFQQLFNDPPDLLANPRIVEGWPPDKPFIATWGFEPSLYPPGGLLLFAPPAAMYSLADISFTESNRLAIQFLLIYAHVSIFLMFVVSVERGRIPPETILALALAYAMVIHWTVEGFYDSVWIAPLLLTSFFIVRKQPLPALLTFSMGVFMHFRALFYLPWAAEAAVRFVTDREWKTWTRSKAIAVGATVLMGAAALWTFWVLRDAFTSHTKTNVYNPFVDSFELKSVLALGLIVLLGFSVLFYNRAWREAVMVLWVGALIMLLPQTNPWSGVALLPWLLSPVEAGENQSIVRPTRIVTAILLIALVFPDSIKLDWIKTAIERIT